jgi:acetyltransferase-like isoleucine patch superfamily enzyme
MLLEKPRIPLREVLLFGFLPGILKIWIYRLRGYRIGRRVSIGFGSVICAERVEVGDDTKIGFLTIIRGKDVKLGSRVKIGSTTFLDTPHIEIGDGTKINEQVFVGGLQFPDSKLIVGRNCQIMQMSFINPARTITIGDDTGIGGHCLIFGHTSWLSQFEGYPVDFQPIEIGRSVSLAWRVFVLPGTRIGDGAVVGANSVVSRIVPPRCLTVGFPARVVSQYPDFPREVGEEEKIGMLANIMKELFGSLSQAGFACEGSGTDHEIRRISTNWWTKKPEIYRLRVIYRDVEEGDVPSAGDGIDVFLSLREIPTRIRQRLGEQNITWIEIARKEQSKISNRLGEEVSGYLARYGVRTFRVDTA